MMLTTHVNNWNKKISDITNENSTKTALPVKINIKPVKKHLRQNLYPKHLSDSD